jgi:diguanylate cyclase (GGDEF)-like protein/PAS domain S-box-containing protein
MTRGTAHRVPRDKRLSKELAALRVRVTANGAEQPYRGSASEVLHALIASITALINSSSLDEGAPKALRMIGEALDVDRCLIFEKIDRAGAPPNVIPTYQWNKAGLEPLLLPFVAEMDNHPDVRSWLAPLSENKPVITTLANANATVRGILRARKATSIVLIPILVAGRNWGHIGLDDGTPDREWTTAEIEPLLALATLFGVTIERGRQIQQLAEADTIIRSSPTILYRMSAAPDMPMTYVSPNVGRLGYDQARMLAEPTFYRTLIHPDDRARVAADQAQALRGLIPSPGFECRFLAADGNYRWFEIHRRSIVDADGKLREFEGELIDINERKLAEQEVNKSHALLEMAERLGHAGAWEWDIVHDRLTWSDELYRICGRDPKTFVPTIAGFFACVHPDDRDRVKAAVDATVTRHLPIDDEFRIVRPDGEARLTRTRGELTVDAAGNPVKLMGNSHDITELKAAENALKRERDFSDALIDSVPGFLVLIDDKGRFARWNANLSALTGLSAEQLRGLEASSIVIDSDRDKTRAQLREAFGQASMDIEFEVRAKTGDVRTVRWSGRSIDKDGHRYLLGAGIDVTETRKAETLLRAVALSASEIETTTNLDASIRKAMDLVSTAIRIDRMGVMEHSATPHAPPLYRYAWSAPDAILKIDERFFNRPTMWTPQMEAWQAPLREGKIVTTDSRTATGDVRKMLEFLGTKTVLLIPIMVHGKYWGIVGFDSCKQEREWPDLEVNILRMLADLIGNAIERDRYIKELGDASRIIERSPIILYRLSAEPALPMIYVSPNVDRLGYEQAKLLAEPTFYRTLIHPDDRARVATDQEQALRGVAPAAVFEVRFLAADGTYRWFENHRTTIAGQDGAPTGFEGELIDITERKVAEQQMTQLARTDQLTGLPNRRVFIEVLQRAIGRARRGEKSCAVLYLDLDHFKDVNDTLGHPVGDVLLQAVAKRLLVAVREADTVARFGGDEFAVLLADIAEPADTVVVAEKILKALNEPLTIQGTGIRSGASIGITVYEEGAADAETLLSHADVALYRAKAEGRGIYRFFTEAMDSEVRDRVKLTSELRDAIASNQLFLMYQPQVETETGRIIGLEALARWNHPTRGLVPPNEFIPIAEKSGLIVALGRWVLHEACRQTKDWLDAGVAPPLVAVNVSALQFKKSHELENDIAAILAETGLPPERLELELTESVFMEISRNHTDALERLREFGLRLAIDDFGTGYSSLEYLGRLPVNRIKIAQNFMSNLTTGSRNGTIVRTAIGMAHELGLDAIVEGVETAEQLQLVRSWSGYKVQGFYFSKPLPAAEVVAHLRRGKISPARPVAVKAAAQ